MFLHTPQHALTPSQIKTIKDDKMGDIIHLKDVDPDLFKALSQCPADYVQLFDLTNWFYKVLKDLGAVVSDSDSLYVHLPLGSPAFMALLMMQRDTRLKDGIYFDPVFSHSVRVSQDLPDGRKVSKFDFKGFIDLGQ